MTATSVPAPNRSGELVFLIDLDNTLLDNDRVIRDLTEYIEREHGKERQERYFRILEELRAKLGYVDYLGALQQLRLENADEQSILRMSSFLIDYPFADRLYPGALRVLAHLGSLGKTVLLTDGDLVFQLRKVQRSGIWDVVDGRVLIYVHKEQMLGSVERCFPARHYVMIDDKIRILNAVRTYWKERVTTILPRQGHYAKDPAAVPIYGRPTFAIEHIADLLKHDFSNLVLN